MVIDKHVLPNTEDGLPYARVVMNQLSLAFIKTGPSDDLQKH